MALNRFILTTAIIPFMTFAAHAQSPTNDLDDEVIVTALRAVALSDVTSSVTILDLDELKIRNSPFVVDQLRAVPSVGVSRNGGLGNLTQVRIRGAEANHTLVLLNGIEVSDPITGETDFGLWSGLNTQRIEVARGEQSGIYGSDAIGGVVSITTGGEGFTAAGEGGSFGTFRGNAGYHGQVEGLSYGLALSGFTTNGVDISGTEDGDRDGSNSYSGIYTAAIEFNPNVTLSALGSYRLTESDFDGFLSDANNRTDADQWIAALSLDVQTGALNHIISASYNRLMRENFADDLFSDETIGQRTKVSYSPSIDLGNENQGLRFSGLAEIENEDYERVNTLFGDASQVSGFNSFSLGGEARAHFNDFALNGSIRFDDNDNQFDDATTWRVGAAYNTVFGGKLWGSIGTGIKNPTFDELFGFFPDFFVGNPDLVPERSESWEVGYDQSFGPFTASLTYFNADLEDEIFTNFSVFPSTAENRLRGSERSGFEVSAGWQVNDAISMSGFVSNIDSDNDEGEPEIRVPEWTASASANWESQSKNGFRAGLAVDFVGEQLDTDFSIFDPVTFQSPDVSLDSYFLLSLTAEYPVADNISLTFRGDNLLDETLTDVIGFNQPGAGVFFGFKIR